MKNLKLQKPWYSEKEIVDKMTREEWKEALKKEKREGEEAAEKMKRFVKEQWPDKKIWFEMMDELDKLSLEELRDLTTKMGICFVIGNENIKNKQEFILVLDEAKKDELLREYDEIIKKKGGGK